MEYKLGENPAIYTCGAAVWPSESGALDVASASTSLSSSSSSSSLEHLSSGTINSRVKFSNEQEDP